MSDGDSSVTETGSGTSRTRNPVGDADEAAEPTSSSSTRKPEKPLFNPQKYFTYVGPNGVGSGNYYFKCTKCGIKKSTSGSSRSNLYTHLKKCRSLEAVKDMQMLIRQQGPRANRGFNEVEEVELMSPDDGLSNNQPTRRRTIQTDLAAGFTRMGNQKKPMTQKEFEDDLVEYMVMELVPFRRVESPHFQKFIKRMMCGRKHIENFEKWGLYFPSRQTISRRVSNLYHTIKAKLEDTLKDVDQVCTTADVWTSHNRSFFGSTVHWVDPATLERHSACLGLKQLHERHTYDVLAKTLHAIHEEFQLVGKVGFTITDGASNFRKAFSVFGEADDEVSASGTIGKQPRPQKTIQPARDQQEKSDSEESEEDDSGDSDEEDEDEMVFEEISDTLEGCEEENRTGFEGLSDSEFELPKHGKCCAHKLNLASTKDAARCQKDPKKQSFSGDLKLKPDSTPTVQEVVKTQKQFTTVMSKLKAVWNKQSRSNRAAEIIRKKAARMFPVENTTRWNSTFDAIEFVHHEYGNKNANVSERKLKLKKLNDICKEMKLGDGYFTRTDKDFMEEYVRVFQGISLALDILQGEGTSGGRNPNLSVAYLLPTLQRVLEHLEPLCLDKEKLKFCRPMAIHLYNGIKERFKSELDDDSLKVASAVHPKFRLSWIKGETEKTRIKALVIERAKDLFLEKSGLSGQEFSDGERGTNTDHLSDDSGSGPESPRLDRFLDFSSSKKKRKTNLVVLEEKIEVYLNADARDSRDDVKDFGLTDLYLKTNTRLPSSAAVERLFSLAGRIFVPTRAKLTGHKFERLTFLRANWFLLPKE